MSQGISFRIRRQRPGIFIGLLVALIVFFQNPASAQRACGELRDIQYYLGQIAERSNIVRQNPHTLSTQCHTLGIYSDILTSLTNRLSRINENYWFSQPCAFFQIRQVCRGGYTPVPARYPSDRTWSWSYLPHVCSNEATCMGSRAFHPRNSWPNSSYFTLITNSIFQIAGLVAVACETETPGRLPVNRWAYLDQAGRLASGSIQDDLIQWMDGQGCQHAIRAD